MLPSQCPPRRPWPGKGVSPTVDGDSDRGLRNKTCPRPLIPSDHPYPGTFHARPRSTKTGIAPRFITPELIDYIKACTEKEIVVSMKGHLPGQHGIRGDNGAIDRIEKGDGRVPYPLIRSL